MEQYAKLLEDALEQESESRELFNELYINDIKRDTILNEAVQFVNEVYVGKTPTLEKIENQIGLIRRNLNRFDDFDSNKETQALNRLFEQQFGMDVFALHMDYHKEMDAWTWALSSHIDIIKNVDFSKWITADRKDGFRFKPKNGFCISANVSYGILGNPDLTDAEVVAIILHEIGHNFADFLDNKVYFANRNYIKSIKKLLRIKAIIISIFTFGLLTPLAIYDYKKTLKQFYNSNKREKEEKLQNDYNKERGEKLAKRAEKEDEIYTKQMVKAKTDEFTIRSAEQQKGYIYKNKAKITKANRESIDRRNEIIADKFTAVYGYGLDLGSALDKIDKTPSESYKIIAQMPGGKKINDRWEEIYKDITEFDCHPHTIQRINENIKILEDELNRADMDPKMKGVIKSQIKDMKELTKEIGTRINKNPKGIQIGYDAYVYKELPDATTEKIEQEINDNFNKLLKSKKK